MVQFSNSSTAISIINPIELAANREANLLCPRVVMDDPELTLTLKLVEIKLYNLCLELNDFKILADDSILAGLTQRKERTARSYVTKLTKLGKLQKLASKEKGKYLLAFKYEEWMRLSSSQVLTIDQEFNLLSTLPVAQPIAPLPLIQHPKTHLSIEAPATTQQPYIDNTITISTSESDNNADAIDHNVSSTITLTSSKINSEVNNAPEVEEAERLYLELSDEQEDILFPLFAIIENQWGTNGKLAQLKTEWFKASEKDCWDDFLQETILSEIKLGYASELKEVLAGSDYNDQDEAKNTAAFALLGRYDENQELETVETAEAKAEVVEAVTEYLPQAVGELQPTSFSQNNFIQSNQNSNNAYFPALAKETTSNKEVSNSNFNLVDSKPNTTHIADTNLAMSCQNPVTAKTLTSNVKTPIHSQAQNLARHCQDNQTRDTKLSLAKPSSPKPSQDWQSIGDVLGTSASKSIIEQIISNVELAKSCQNDQTQNTELVANQKLGNSLPASERTTTTSPITVPVQTMPSIPNNLEVNNSTSFNTSTSPITSTSKISPRQAIAMLRNTKRF